MLYFVTGIIIGLLVLINGIYKIKENMQIFIVSTICGLGLISSGILGIIFEKIEFFIILSLIVFAAIYIIYSVVLNKKMGNTQEIVEVDYELYEN